MIVIGVGTLVGAVLADMTRLNLWVKALLAEMASFFFWITTGFVNMNGRNLGRTGSVSVTAIGMGTLRHNGHAVVVNHRHLRTIGQP